MLYRNDRNNAIQLEGSIYIDKSTLLAAALKYLPQYQCAQQQLRIPAGLYYDENLDLINQRPTEDEVDNGNELNDEDQRRFNKNVQSGITQHGTGNMNLQGNIQQVGGGSRGSSGNGRKFCE